MSKIKARLLTQIITSCHGFIADKVQETHKHLAGTISGLKDIREVIEAYEEYKNWQIMHQSFQISEMIPAELGAGCGLSEFENFLFDLESNTNTSEALRYEAGHLVGVLRRWNEAAVGKFKAEPADTSQPFEEAIKEVQDTTLDGEPF